MGDLSAEHYLEIYRGRLSMAEMGITHPRSEVVEFFRKLVAGLSVLALDEKIRLENKGGIARFMVSETGDLIAELRFPVPN